MKTKWIFRIAFYLIIAVIVFACQPKAKLTATEGFVEVTGGKVWYRIVGTGNQTPIVLLHGGPGFPSYYLNPLAKLGQDRPVIFFDQLGCGRSDDNSDTTLMTIDIFVEQLEQFTSALGLTEFFLYGQSWGTMLGIDYYSRYPDKIKALVFASPAFSTSIWIADCKELVATLPDSIQKAIDLGEESKNYESAEYQNAVNIFYQNFVARKLPWDANMDSTFKEAGMHIYRYMWGPSEFTATGTLRNFDRTDRLAHIKILTLYICGEFDEACPATVKYYQSLTPGAKFEIIENSGHVTMHDNPEKDLRVIAGFLNEIEKK